MNIEMRNFARTYLLDNLNRLPESNQRSFKLMYGRLGGKRSVDDAVSLEIGDVVPEIPDDKLDWAMQQVMNTLR